MDPCALAVTLPEGGVTQAEAETAWRADRVALADCRAKHGALADWARGIVTTLKGDGS